MTSVAIVSGASQGIGRATAIRLARDFNCIVLVARNLSGLQETEKLMESSGCRTLLLDVDLGKPASADIIVSRTIDEFGRIDALINIAGAVPQIHLLDMTDEQWNNGMEVKFHGARRLTIRAWDALKASRGSVVLMSGNSATIPKAPYAAVAAINAAIVALAKAFSDMGVADEVQVNSVLPGAVMTNRRHTFLEKWAAARSITVEQATEKFPAEAGIRRFGAPEEIAELMAFLVSPAAHWMTGSAIRMDGGETKAV